MQSARARIEKEPLDCVERLFRFRNSLTPFAAAILAMYTLNRWRVYVGWPYLAATAALQLRLAAAGLAVGRRYTLVPAHLAWPELSGELAAAVAVAVAIASVVARTRWHELGGAIAAPVSLVVTAATQATWANVTWRIMLVGALAVATAAWAQRDPWLRLHPAVRHRHIAVHRKHTAVGHRHPAVPRKHTAVSGRGVGK